MFMLGLRVFVVDSVSSLVLGTPYLYTLPLDLINRSIWRGCLYVLPVGLTGRSYEKVAVGVCLNNMDMYASRFVLTLGPQQ